MGNRQQNRQQIATKKNEKNVKSKSFAETDVEFRLSNLLLSFILKRRPQFKTPDLQKWAKHIDLMIRKDNRDPQEIQHVIKWCQEDDFWQNNVLSTANLRQKFDKLALQMQGNRRGNHNASIPTYLSKIL